MQDFVTSHVGHLENTNILNYIDVPNVDIFSLYKNLKLHSLILPPISLELSVRKLSYFQ